MEDPLAEDFDVLVLGTGLTQAVLAAFVARGRATRAHPADAEPSRALARAGKKVLHLDHVRRSTPRWGDARRM